MTAIVLLIACMVLGHARATVVELNCSDNATCIDFMAKEFARSMRQQRPVRIFDVLTIEPVERTRQARVNQGWLSKFLESHAFSFDWNDWSFRLSKPEDRSGVLDLEVFESRTAKDASSEQIPKKSNSKVEEDEEDKTPKRRTGLKRRQKKKMLQAIIPMMFGMKSAGTVIFALVMVTALTLKAFVASKLALAVTVGMAVKRLYETYGQGIPETSNVLWNIANFFKGLFSPPGLSPLSQPSMPMPMYMMPGAMQMYGQPMAMPDMHHIHMAMN